MDLVMKFDFIKIILKYFIKCSKCVVIRQSLKKYIVHLSTSLKILITSLSLVTLLFNLFLAAIELFSNDPEPAVCNDPVRESSFPPPIPHQILNSSYIEKYDEILFIGDVHGSYKELQLLLTKANATDVNVLKVLSGDLVMKGSQSLEVIRFVRSDSSVISVRGNNDWQALYKYFKTARTRRKPFKGKKAFLNFLNKDDIQFLISLPYTISIPSLNSIIVHAGLRPGIPLEDNNPYVMMNIRDLVADDRCTNGYRPHQHMNRGIPWASKWNGPQHVYFGHNRRRSLQLYPLASGLDTQCVQGHNLTGMFIKGPRKNQLVTIKCK